MKWTGAQIIRASEPAWPLGLGAAIAVLDKLFKVQSDAGAALVGVAIAAIMFVGILLFAGRMKKYGAGPMWHPLLLPWGVAFVVLGGVMMALREPWRYYGFGILFIGALYMLMGAVMAVRKTRHPAT